MSPSCITTYAITPICTISPYAVLCCLSPHLSRYRIKQRTTQMTTTTKTASKTATKPATRKPSSKAPAAKGKASKPAVSKTLNISVDDVLAFRNAVATGKGATVAKIRIAAKYLNGGATHAAVAQALITQCALTVNPVSFRGEIAQYAKAISIATAAKVIRNDDALLMAKSVSNGSIKATTLDTFAANFTGTPTAFIKRLVELRDESKKSAKGKTTATASATVDSESETVTEPETVSPVSDALAAIKQLRAIWALDLSDDDRAEINAALFELGEFVTAE